MSEILTSAAHAAGAERDDAMPRPAWDPRSIPAARLTAPASEPAGILSRSTILRLKAEREAVAAADAECACLFSAAEQLAVLADREDGEAGDDPEAIGALALEAAALLVLGLQRLELLDREDHGIDPARLLHEDRLALGLNAEAAKSVLGLGGGDTHGLLLVSGHFSHRPNDLGQW
mgnify:CR=1 FL=1